MGGAENLGQLAVGLRYNEFTAFRAANLGGQEWRK